VRASRRRPHLFCAAFWNGSRRIDRSELHAAIGGRRYLACMSALSDFYDALTTKVRRVGI
jgi:hypothetical protein